MGNIEWLPIADFPQDHGGATYLFWDHAWGDEIHPYHFAELNPPERVE